MKPNPVAAHFKTLDLGDVPHSRAGKNKENVRSALNRASRNAKLNVATATDEDFLYVWNVSKSA